MTPNDIDASAAGSYRLGDRAVRRMGFGSMRLTVNPETGAAIRVLRRAVELGVDHIDTAAFYRTPGGIIDVGPGPVRYATELIRNALSPYPETLVIATKVGPNRLPDHRWGDMASPALLRRQVEENLRLLGVDTLDLVNLRMVRTGTGTFAERFGALAEMRLRLAWTLHRGEHVLAIPGTGDVAHLEQNIAAGALTLRPEDLTEIDQSV
ncbi:aldo/keto reductase [Actinoplanes sp. NPDC051851]|uniref:aldo/keto reductase n=1 Tax=Actinoplanes sp. NPDC051851 TaxID=3154753 RepID=UPI0034176F82